MFKKIWVEVCGNKDIKLLKKISNLGINIYDIKYKKDKIYLYIDSKNFDKLTKYIVSYKFKKVDSIFKRLKRQKVFIITLSIGLILFLILNNMIFKINIIHENTLIREIIEDELDSYGIKVLSFKKSYSEYDEIREEILDKHPDLLDWMEFDLTGMVLNVRVEERIITDTSKEDKVCDLVATKSGVVTNMVITSGEAVVMLNDYVRKGDILVTGTIKYNEEDKRYTCASGEVYASTWYQVSVSIPLEYQEYEETGEVRYNLVYEIDEVKKEVFKNRLDRYQRDLTSILKIFNFNLYLAKDVEVKKTSGTYTEEEALNEGLKRVETSIEQKLGENIEIIDEKVLKKVVNNSTMDIDVFVVVNELISTSKETLKEGID